MAHDWGGIIDYEKAHDRPSLLPSHRHFVASFLLYNTLDLVAERGPSTYSTLIWHSANAQYLVTYLLHVLYIWLNVLY